MINGRKHAARPLQGILNYANGSKRMRRRRPPSLKMKSLRIHTARTRNPSMNVFYVLLLDKARILPPLSGNIDVENDGGPTQFSTYCY